MKYFGGVRHDSRKNWFDYGGNPVSFVTVNMLGRDVSVSEGAVGGDSATLTAMQLTILALAVMLGMLLILSLLLLWRHM